MVNNRSVVKSVYQMISAISPISSSGEKTPKWLFVVKKLVKINIYFLTIAVIVLVGMDLLISDLGPGETQIDRLRIIAVYLVISGFVLFLFKKFLKKY